MQKHNFVPHSSDAADAGIRCHNQNSPSQSCTGSGSNTFPHAQNDDLLDPLSHTFQDIDHEDQATSDTNQFFTAISSDEWEKFMSELGAPPVLPTLETSELVKGSAAKIQRFYEGRKTCDCCTNWVEKPPAQVPDEAREKYDGVAIRMYYGKDHTKETFGGLKRISPSNLIVQSPVILKAIEPILKKVGRVITGESFVVFSPPFSDLFFAHAGIAEALGNSEKGSEENTHLTVMKEIADELLRETTSAVTELHAKRSITWSYLWTLFPKDIIIVSKVDGQDCLFEVTGFNNAGFVTCRSVSFDGSNYGFRTYTFTQTQFWGARAIHELVFYPISFHKTREELETKVLQRSRAALTYQNIVHAQYDKLLARKVQTTERIILDPYGREKFASRGKIQRLTSDDDTALDERLGNHFQERKSKGRLSSVQVQENIDIISTRPRWLLLLDPFIDGYSLQGHTFGRFFVDHIHPIKWNEQAFGRLVFPNDSKALLLTLVKNHGRMGNVGQDIIQGKGGGFIVLLSGPPGTGKTLTAEAGKHRTLSVGDALLKELPQVADQARRPLYRIHAGKLYDTQGGGFFGLEEALERAAEWNSLLLIDEIDAYLPKNDHHRSRGANILLEKLEYYSGILFLTTNFCGEIDEAIASRIDVHLRYPKLDRTARSKLFKNMVEFAGSSEDPSISHDLTEQDFWNLSKWQLNGREIKNAVKVSARMCYAKQEKLSYLSLEAAIRHTARGDFDELTPDAKSGVDSDTGSGAPKAKRARIE